MSLSDIATLQDHLTMLEQENETLRSRLQACEHSHRMLQTEVAELRRREQIRQGRDRLLEAMATATNALLGITQFDEAVNTALQIIGESLECDRITVIENFDHPDDGSVVYWKALYGWTSPHVASQLSHPELGQGSYEGIEAWYARLSQGQTISCLLEDMPEPFRSGQAALELKALHVVPIFVEGRYWGVVGFDDCREVKHRSSAELAVLKIVADCLGSAIQRERTQQALLQAEQARSQELERANDALQGTVTALAECRDLEGFIGEVLHTIAREFDSPLVEYWQTLGTDIVEINTWLSNNQIFSLKKNDQHPGRGGIRLLPEQIELEDFIHRNKILFFDHPIPAYSLAVGEVICPTEWYAAYGVSRHFNFPLQAGKATVGFIGVWLPPNRQVSEACLRLGQALSHQTALAIQLTHLAEEVRQGAITHEKEKAAQTRVAELAKANAALRNTTKRLASEPQLESFLGYVLLEACVQVGAAAGHLSTYDTERRTLSTVAHVEDGQVILNLNESFPEEFQLHSPCFFDILVEEGARQSNLIVIAEETRMTSLQRDYFLGQGIWGILSVPLVLNDRPEGTFAIHFLAPRTFRDEELELVQTLANQAALAIELTRLSEQAKESALLEERNRLAGEIHDTLAQAFTGISMQLNVVKWLIQHNPMAVDETLDLINNLAQNGLAEARRSVWTLYPVDQAYGDLAEKLSRCVEQMTSGTPMQVRVQISGSPCPLSPLVGKNLLRIGQEAITNTLKHAQANALNIHLTYTEQSLCLCIQDNGQGFLTELDRSGFGLISMSDRADRINGQLTIDSQLGQGTTICIQVPLP